MDKTRAFSIAAVIAFSLAWTLAPGCGSDPAPNASGGGGNGQSSSSGGDGCFTDDCSTEGATCVFGDTMCVNIFVCKQGTWENQGCSTSSSSTGTGGAGGAGGMGGAGGNGGMGGNGTGGTSGGGGK